MSVRELVLLIFWGISCILITVQIIKIRKEKAKIPDKNKNLAKFMVGMIAVYSIFVLIMCSGMKDFMTMMIPTVIASSRTLTLYQPGLDGDCDDRTAFSHKVYHRHGNSFLRYSIDRLWDKEPTKRNSQYYYGGEYSIRTADAVRGIKR